MTQDEDKQTQKHNTTQASKKMSNMGVTVTQVLAKRK